MEKLNGLMIKKLEKGGIQVKKQMKYVMAVLMAVTLTMTGVIPVDYVQAATKSTTVTTQSELNQALSNTSVTNIKISTSSKKTFTIESGSYIKKTLIVNAAKASVVNKGEFKAINIKAIGASFKENASQNSITVSDANANISIASGKETKSLIVTSSKGTLTTTVNGTLDTLTLSGKAGMKLVANGTVKEVTINAASALTISGTTTAIIPVINNTTKTVTVKTPSDSVSVLAGTSENINSTSSLVPTLSIESNDIYGSATTSGHTTVKAELGTKVEYTGEAVLKLSMNGNSIDNSLIDSSKATVTLSDGDGYYASEFIFKATTLSGNWSNGELSYTLKEGDLEYNNNQYYVANGGREWSCLGGDGGGNYYFNLTVSGITYNGKKVPNQTFRVHIYIYGRDYSA